MPLLPLLLFFLFFFGGMFLLVIFQARRHREALALLATQQRAMQAEVERLADLLESLVAERPLTDEFEAEGAEEKRDTGFSESPGADASWVPGLEMMLSRGGEVTPEGPGGAPAHLSLRPAAAGGASGGVRENGGMPELRM